MSNSLTQSLLALFGLMAVASVVSCLVYGVFRWLENHFPKAIFVISVLGVGTVTLLALSLPPVFSQLLILLLFLLVIGSFVGWLHIKSGGISESVPEAMFVMMAMIMTNIIVYNFLLELKGLSVLVRVLNSSFLRQNNSSFVFFSLLISQTFAPPLLIWMWKSSKLRPGVDIPFSDESKTQEEQS